MSFETVEGTLNIICTMVMTTALAAILGAWLNVKINTGSLKDKAFAADAEARGQAILDCAVPAADYCFARILKMVEG